MKRELLHHPAAQSSKPVKLLFIHGICNSAWIWEQNFLPYFARAGFDSFALSLRGHGRGEGRESIRRFSLADFADDVEWAVKEIGGPVVVVGYSLGGAVVQNYIQRGGKAHGVVLLNAVPPHGLMRASAVMAAQNPHLWNELKKAMESGLSAANAEVLEDALFATPPSSDLRDLVRQRAVDVPETACRQVSGWTPFAPFPWIMPKLLVIGCERDQYVPGSDARLAAIYYGARAVILPEGCHAIMLDESWEQAARPMLEWLDRTPFS